MNSPGNTLLTLFTFFLLILVAVGCQRQSSNNIAGPETSFLSGTFDQNELQLIHLGNGNQTLNKIVSTRQLVTYKDGGELIIDYKGYEHNYGDVEVKETLKIFSETISSDRGPGT